MSCSEFKVHSAKQLTVLLDGGKLDKLFRKLNKRCVKLRAWSQQRVGCDEFVLKLVSTNSTLKELECLLSDLCLKSSCDKVLIVELPNDNSNLEVRNRLRRHVDVIASYLDRCGNGVFQVSSYKDAKRALTDESEESRDHRPCDC